MNVAESVSEIVRHAKSATEDDRTHEILAAIRALPGIEELNGPLTFRSGGHEIQVGLTAHLEKSVNSLKELAPLKLSVAPELVAHLPFSDQESVLVTRYPAAEGQKLRSLKPTDAPVAEAVRDRARAELGKLAEHGLIHNFAGRGFAHWLTNADKNTLVLDGWTALRSANEGERAEHLEQVDGVLARLA